MALEMLAVHRAELNGFDMNLNERRRALKFEIQLTDEAEKLNQLENLDEENAKNIDLDDIGIGQKPKENTMFGGSNFNKKLALEF